MAEFEKVFFPNIQKHVVYRKPTTWKIVLKIHRKHFIKVTKNKMMMDNLIFYKLCYKAVPNIAAALEQWTDSNRPKAALI